MIKARGAVLATFSSMADIVCKYSVDIVLLINFNSHSVVPAGSSVNYHCGLLFTSVTAHFVYLYIISALNTVL